MLSRSARVLRKSGGGVSCERSLRATRATHEIRKRTYYFVPGMAALISGEQLYPISLLIITRITATSGRSSRDKRRAACRIAPRPAVRLRQKMIYGWRCIDNSTMANVLFRRPRRTKKSLVAEVTHRRPAPARANGVFVICMHPFRASRLCSE